MLNMANDVITALIIVAIGFVAWLYDYAGAVAGNMLLSIIFAVTGFYFLFLHAKDYGDVTSLVISGICFILGFIFLYTYSDM